MWFFDSALGVLVWYQAESKRVSFWNSKVWEAAGWTWNGMRGLPAAPRAMHDALVQIGSGR